RSRAGAPLAAVFTFLSGLYFRGKITYAEAFGRPPPGLSGGLVISPGAGLRFPHEPVTLERLAEWSKVPIDASNPRFTRPLVELPGAGKTTFFDQRLAATHVHVSKDRFPNNRRPAHRQAELIEEALASHRSVVVDNTNVTIAERAPILSQARAHGARVVGFVF